MLEQEELEEYWADHKLVDLFDKSASSDQAIPADKCDLARIHYLIRKRKSFTALEFGVGFSTIIIADALRKNKEDWEKLSDKPNIRNRYLFQCFSIDASEKWIEHTENHIPANLKEYISIQYSKVKIGTFQGQLCHFYESLPDIVPDFIYLDGPDPKMVEGTINGLSFQCDERTVMAGDLLLMEPTFLPGTLILVDGRTNNVRFLQNNFRRKYQVYWNQEGDVTTFDLQEPRLGKYNILGSDFY